MVRSYDRMLGYVFKVNSLRFARRTLWPTLKYYLTRPALPPSDQPVLCTMNILPPLMTVWYHFARKALGNGADIVIFDCTGILEREEFPEARVLPFLNFYAATKGNECIRHIARHRRIVWLCDDDMFLLSHDCLPILQREFAIPKTASVSFRPREWWEFDISGQRMKPSSSYCTAIDREIFVREKLSLAPAGGNPHPATLTRPPRRYDTFDKANEILLKRGYRCAILSEEERRKCVTGFSGVSGAVMLLNYFKTPEETLNFFRTPPPECWSGNLLFGLMSAMLSVSAIQELYTSLKGTPYLMPSLPKRDQLLSILEQRKQFLRTDQTLEAVERTTERLRATL
jgi:hypothetical protein